MSRRFSLVATIILFLAYLSSSYQLNAVTITQSQLTSETPRSLAYIISQSQPELLQKAVLHYLIAQIDRMQRTHDQMAIKNFLRSWFQPSSIEGSYQVIQKNMRTKLSNKLEMDQLTESFKKQIQENPEEYFLTFDMYDLLIDE